MSEDLFVYGTLRRGQPAHHLIRGGRVVRARVRGRVTLLGAFRALIPGGGHWVPGELIAVPAARFPALDRYEGPIYRRVRVRVRTAAGPRECWVYVPAIAARA